MDELKIQKKRLSDKISESEARSRSGSVPNSTEPNDQDANDAYVRDAFTAIEVALYLAPHCKQLFELRKRMIENHESMVTTYQRNMATLEQRHENINIGVHTLLEWLDQEDEGKQ